MRRELYALTHNQIEEINGGKDVTFLTGHNHFSDMTHDEYVKHLGTWNRSKMPTDKTLSVQAPFEFDTS